jgi:hypothetical protein
MLFIRIDLVVRFNNLLLSKDGFLSSLATTVVTMMVVVVVVMVLNDLFLAREPITNQICSIKSLKYTRNERQSFPSKAIAPSFVAAADLV